MALLADITARVRTELGDHSKQFTFNGLGDGTTKSFYLKAKPVELSGLYATVSNVAVAYPAGYTLEALSGIIHFVTAPALNAPIVVQGTANRYFLDATIDEFVCTAVIQHTANRTDSGGSNLTINSIPAVEEYPLAILATIEALWALATDTAFDINITAPDGVVIPRAQRFSQLSSIIAQRWDQYKQLCSALNIGLWRMEMGTLRRVSRTTNKLVPVYMAQEIDDARRPERVYIVNDLNGRAPLPTTVQIFDMAMTQGDSYEVTFDFGFDVTGLVFKSQIRTYPGSPSLYGTFTITVLSTSPTLSSVKMELTSAETKGLPVRAFWDIQVTDPLNPDYQLTYMKGQVFTTAQVTLD
ncbi:hypothetical protein UFOVP965_147 [uncultured Caudovirales phage]|uniref:Uncharacterized protein n=1 Tax=uncultured Caudovirales phage TaxID=2100421 RepID=A0A6J5Q191_9CAUD|nr:hypothetical protein UFOVP965_147 [uncultured Caudovirales phage]CAB4179936.1 hypothetical protein UFOVP1035_143 [uncultured Caudovirales phage]CAB4188796.1 hypothetical protein UFOVP1181_102 [uncultured Caudovirales phage]